MLRVGHIPYLVFEPFFSHLSGFELVRLNPRMLGRAMARGVLDAGPLSLVDFLRSETALTPLPFGIATRGAAQSVLLFSNRPLFELGGAVLAVSPETSTSVELLRILLTLKYEAVPRAWVETDEPHDAVLLIGDQAIQALKSRPRFSHVVDLGSEWVRWMGLPFVFARWAVRSSVPDAEQLALRLALDEGLERGLAALPGIAQTRRDTGFSEAEVVSYLNGFINRLGAEEEKAIAEFSRLLAQVEERQC